MSTRRDGPLIVQSDRTILLDVHHPKANEVREMLGTFAELVKSPENLHTYRVSSLSLWNAAAAGLAPEDVLEFLADYARHALPSNLTREIADIMQRFGRLILRRADDDLVLSVSADLWSTVYSLIGTSEFVLSVSAERGEITIRDAARGEVKRVLTRSGYPIEDIAGYLEGDSLALSLAPGFELRHYQRAAAVAFYQDGGSRGGNGVVVLPCGGGKTIVGIGAMDLYQTKTLVVTNNRTSVRQWIREVVSKTTLTEADVAEYSAEVKNIAPVTVTTYQMLTYRSNRLDAYPHFEVFMRSNWGLVIYDEVHLLPAPVFRLTAELQARRRLGLTATLVREDGREDEVFSLIGPKRYDMPWRRLERSGFVAAARCIEMRVPLTPADRERYDESPRRDRYRVAAENPLKLKALLALLERHRGDRVLVIGMYLRQLFAIRALTGMKIITSKTSQEDRERLYAEFRSGEIDRLLVSKVANFAVDLPDANIAIQISGTFGSRQEEAQRLGRILRPKSKEVDTIFYTLVSDQTCEVTFASNRQLFLTEQGYFYDVQHAATNFPDAGWSASDFDDAAALSLPDEGEYA